MVFLNKTFIKSIIFFLLLSVHYPNIHAAPALPDLIRMKQPDGKELSLFLRGDEKVRWMESIDGYTLLYNVNKYIVYAIQNENGDIIPSNIPAEELSLRSSEQLNLLNTIPKKLFYSEKQIQLFNDIWEVKNTALKSAYGSGTLKSTKGKAYAICALIEFPDRPLTKTKEDFEILFNQTGYNLYGAKGSVRDFYYETSYGQLELTIDVVGPYKAKNSATYYGDNHDQYVRQLATEAAQQAFGNLSAEEISRYDNDGDGYIDAFHFLYAGYGEEAGGEPKSTIWAHKSDLMTMTFKNKKLNTYSCSPELRWNYGSDITHIGVICHELGHIFGAPDFYDANGGDVEFLGTDKWDLMANGCWNGTAPFGENRFWYAGSSPAHINMYQKIHFGWVEPETLSSSRFISEMPNSAENPLAYIYHTKTSGEYFVLENRQTKGFDSAIPGHGLLIYRVSIRNADIMTNSVNNSHPQRVYPVCASVSDYALPTNSVTSYGSIGSTGCPFPGSSKQTEFTDYSIPSALAWNRTETQKPITDITEKNGLISFHFMKSASVTNLSSRIEYLENSARITLSWNPPVSELPFKEYKIYRNDQLLQTTEGTTFRETVSEAGLYLYQVSVVYEDFESDKSSVEITIAFTSIESVSINQLSDQAEFYFYSLQGQLIFRTKSKNAFQSSFPELKAGIYILQIRDRNSIFNRKWIKH